MRGSSSCSCCMLVHMQVKGGQVQANNITPTFTVTIAFLSPISLEPIVEEACPVGLHHSGFSCGNH